MNYKIKKAFKDNKKYIIVFLVLWVVLEILLCMPMAVAINNSTHADGFYFSEFIGNFGSEIMSFSSFTKLGQEGVMPILGRCTLGLTIIFLVFSTIGIIRSKPRNEFKDIENGSSDWSEGGEQYKILSRNKGIILAEDNYLPVDKPGNVNVLVVGGSGSGKSASYSIPNACQLLGSYVFTDPKGELYDKTAGFLRSHGYDIKVLNLVNPENSDSYNPLMHIQNNIDVDIIAHTIVKGQEGGSNSSDPFWDDNAETLLKALIYYLLTVAKDEEKNLASCAELVRAASNKNGSSLLGDLISELPPDNQAVTNYKSIELASDKTYSSILSTLQSKLSKFDSVEIANVTSTNTINFEEIANRKTALYVISSDTHTAYNFLLTIFFSQLIQQLYDIADKNGGRLKVPLYFILDEFANIGQIPDFDKKISTSRSRGISFSVILQNLDQLEAVYEKSYETIMGNCDTHVFLGSNSFKTVEYFSKQLGEKTIIRDTRSTNRGRNYSTQGYSTSDQIMGRALMTPDELRRMDNDLCIIFEKGLKPVKANKYYYFKKPVYRQLQANRADHNDYIVPERGEWSKFNPSNPRYADDTRQEEVKIESLDDLWSDNTNNKNNTTSLNSLNNSGLNNNGALNSNIPNNITTPVNQNTKNVEIEPLENMFNNSINNQNNSNPMPKTKTNTTNKVENIDAPVIPMEDNTQEDDLFTMDLQKELEAKFDELFGPIDNNTNNNN